MPTQEDAGLKEPFVPLGKPALRLSPGAGAHPWHRAPRRDAAAESITEGEAASSIPFSRWAPLCFPMRSRGGT